MPEHGGLTGARISHDDDALVALKCIGGCVGLDRNHVWSMGLVIRHIGRTNPLKLLLPQEARRLLFLDAYLNVQAIQLQGA